MPSRIGIRAKTLGLGAAVMLSVACTGNKDTPAATQAEPVFAGSQVCAGCHSAEVAAWQGSHHQLAMQHVSGDTVLGDFSGSTLEHFGASYRFFRDGERFRVETREADGEQAVYDVEYVFGVEPLQQYLVPTEGGRLQALSVAWDTRPVDEGGQRWFHLYPDEAIPPGDDLHWSGLQFNWNFMCAECHSTDVHLGFDAAGNRFDTTYAEVSVGCEACHGPGSVHVAEAEDGRFSDSLKGLVLSLDDDGRATWIMNPETGIAARSEPAVRPPQQPESCGRCHARRAVISDDYEFGKALADTHMPAMLEQGLYYADGQILDEVYVYGSFLQSRMYQAGVTCSSCHEPHSLSLRTGPDPDAVCAQCHLPQRFAASSHTGHDEGAVACVDCHMPERTYMVVDPRRDHGFRVPRPDLTAVTGAPDACTGCHDDRDAAWAANRLLEWHGAPPEAGFAPALAAAWLGEGNAYLHDTIRAPATPGIARATLITRLQPPLQEADAGVIVAGLADADPLVRVAAVRGLRLTPPEFRVRHAAVLEDRVRAVRIEAALAFADVQALLPEASRNAFAHAAADFRSAQTMQLNRPEAWTALGNFAVASGRMEEGLGHYEQALAIAPSSVPVRVNLADALRLLGDDTRGREVLSEGISRVPDAAGLHHALGLLLVRQRELDAALVELEQAVLLDPGNARYRYVLDVARSEIGQPLPDQPDTDGPE